MSITSQEILLTFERLNTKLFQLCID